MTIVDAFLLIAMGLFGGAVLFRWRYLTWLIVFGSVWAICAATCAWLDREIASEEAPPYIAQLKSDLRARPWPGKPNDILGLISSFRALDDHEDEMALRVAYRLEVAHNLAGASAAPFNTVADALNWGNSAGATNPAAENPASQEIQAAERSALEKALHFEIVHPGARLPGQPPAPQASAFTGSTIPVPSSSPENPAGGSPPLFLQMNYRGPAFILKVDLTLHVLTPPGSAASTSDSTCPMSLVQVHPSEIRWITCQSIGSQGDKPSGENALAAREDRTQGSTIDVQVSSAELDPPPVPQAPILIVSEMRTLTDMKKRDLEKRLSYSSLRWTLGMLLPPGGLYIFGFAIPSVRRRSLSLRTTIAISAVVVLGAVATIWWVVTSMPDNSGFGDLILIGLVLTWSTCFLGGLLFGNFVQSRS